MVLGEYGNLEYVAYMKRKTDIFVEKVQFAAAVDLNKCLTQIKLPISRYMCAPISELL